MIKSEAGKIIFHLNDIKKSYRNRGNVPRIQRMSNIKITIMYNECTLFNFIKNRIIENIIKIIIFRYSAKKIIANHPPMYSTLKPETSSDSPSEKSKGLRFTSAKQLINQK